MNEAEVLFTNIFNCDKLSLYLNKDLRLDKNNSCLIASVLKRRISGQPIQYILRQTEFMGLEFKLTEDVFIPRPETEILVETVLELASGLGLGASGCKILDLGTGSGCVAVSLAKFLKDAKVTASDISPAALEVARENAKRNNVKIDFIQSDLFDTPNSQLLTSDLITCNPPYIPTAEIDDLQPELSYEPRIALDGGKQGLDFYPKIIAAAADYLKSGGFLIIEIGFGQASSIKNIFQNSGNFEIIEVVKDYHNIDRVIVAKNIKSRWIN